MTKQTRRAPERPKAQVENATIESPVVEVTASKPKKKNISPLDITAKSDTIAV